MYRRRFRRKMRPRRKTKQSRWSVYGNAASQLWKDVKYLKSVINVEYKRLDADSTQFIPNEVTSPTLTLISSMAQGDGPNQRDGNSVRLKSALIRFAIERDASATKPHTSFRIMLVRSIYNNNAAPAIGDLLQTSDFMSPINTDESTGYRILRDKTYRVTAQVPHLDLKWFVKFNHHAKFSGSSAAVGDTTSGHIYIVVFVDDNTNQDFIRYYTRVRFVDN